MNWSVKYSLALLVASVGVAAPTTQPGVAAPTTQPVEFKGLSQELKIETGEPYPDATSQGAQHSSRGGQYIVELTVTHLPGLLADLRDHRANDWFPKLLNTPAGQSLSERQKQFVMGSPRDDEDEGRIDWPYWAYDGSFKFRAVSEEDAGKMAQSLVQWIDERSNSELEKYRRLEQMQKAKNIPDKDYAANLKPEFDKLLSLTEVDIAGVKAKQEAIRDIMNKSLNSPGGARTDSYWSHLGQMLTEYDVEMAGLLARQNAVQARRKELAEYLDTVQQLASTQASIQDLVSEGKTKRSSLASYESELTTLQKQLARMALGGPAIIRRIVPPLPDSQPASARSQPVPQ